ncbi:Outer membrane efflux protein [Stieleria maiorica]|uniref:Outer membrane efflux protein n=1 Tax=Stieleria maiorica TaxID=2795974 RepID=A0A5B9ME96_9BACT|nr:TolC family protein [Stieleria maiorica]QEF98556.1 Outer membrane efflux protein [Stieleria maiorica]
MERRRSVISGTHCSQTLLLLTAVFSLLGCAANPSIRPLSGRHFGGTLPEADVCDTAASTPSPADSPSKASGEAQNDPVDSSRVDLASAVAENDAVVATREFVDLLRVDSAQEDEEAAGQATQASHGGAQSVDYFVGIALSRHPKILAARNRVSAAVNLIPQARALPDPMFSNTFWPIHDQALQTAAGRVGNQMSLSQQIPFPQKLDAKASIASHEVRMAQAEVDAIEREITESVRLAYYEIWFAGRAIEIIQETRELVEDLTEVAEARYRSGGSQQDVLRAQLEADRIDDQLVTLRQQKQVAQADLAALLQQPVDMLPETSDQLETASSPEQLEALIALAEQCNPTLQGLAAEFARDRSKESLACLQQYPDLTVGMHWGLVNDNHDVISPVANGHDNISFTVGTTLPIWRSKITAGIREAASRRSSTAQRLEAERDSLYGKVRRLAAQADALIQQRSIYENRIIPRTEDTLKLAISDYRGKRADFFSLIETYRELLMFETQLARIEATLAGTIAQIDRTVGCPAN